jgi:hypothetical protein
MRDDPKDLWLSQPTEGPTMTLRLIQQRSRALRTRTRKKLLGTLAGPLATGVFYAFGMKEFAALRPVIQPLFAFAFAWSLAGLYFLNRRMWSAPIQPDAGLIPSLQFCRSEIERQRDLLRRVLLWSLGPILLAIGAFVLALAMVGTRERGIIPNGLPFLILIVAWIIAYFIIRFREQQALQRELDELKNIERENHTA